MKILTSLTLTLLFGCNNLSGHIEQQVDSKVERAKQDMSAEVQRAKEDFTAHFKATEENQADILIKRKLQELKFSIISTDSYLDSLKREMGKLDENDVRNVELVKATFLYNGVGDSIFNKLKRSIAAAENAAKTDQQKIAIISASESLFTATSADKWKEQMFGLTNPLGASMIIYGLQTELYNIGIKALGDK
jgi:hypothetical protein